MKQQKTQADLVSEQLEQIGNDLLRGKMDKSISKEFNNGVGKRIAIATGQAKLNSRGHKLAIPFYGITPEMEVAIQKPKTSKQR